MLNFLLDIDWFTWTLFTLTVSYLTHLGLIGANTFGYHPRYHIILDADTSDAVAVAFNRLDYLRLWMYRFDGNILYPKYRTLEILFTCPYCLGFWVCLVLLPGLIMVTDYAWYQYVLSILAVPMVAGRLN